MLMFTKKRAHVLCKRCARFCKKIRMFFIKDKGKIIDLVK